MTEKTNFGDFASALPAVIYCLERDANNEPHLLYIAGACKELLGLDPDEARANPSQLNRMVVEEDQPALVESAKRARDAVEVWEHEYRIRNAEGEIRYVRAIARPTPFDDGRMQWTGVIIDVTHHKIALRESEHLTSIVRYSDASVITVDLDGTILSWNPGAERIFGYRADEVLGHPISILHPENMPDEREAVLGRVRAGASINNRETVRRRKDGALVDVSLTASPIFNAAGEVTSVSSLIFDISDKQRILKEREELQARLRNSERLESLGVLAGGIAHDFNNLLYAIHGNVELAMRELSGGQARHNLEAVLAAARRASSMTSQILAFSRSAKRSEESVDVEMMVSEAVEVLRSYGTKELAIRVESDGRPHSVLGDSAQIYQLLSNLFTNAAESLESSGTVEIRTDSVSPSSLRNPSELTADRYTRITIRDSGSGISPRAIDRIFEPFFTTRRGEGGTGMGLSVAHGIVKSHEGRIEVDSTLGAGTTFTVYLPEVATTESEVAVETSSGSGLERGRERVLFVDDEAPLVRMAGEMLQALGYRCDGFTSGVSALEFFRRDPKRFQLVITDQIMPDMSGDILVGRLRQIRSDIPIIVSSGYREGMSAKTISRLDADAYLDKPISMQVLSSTLRDVLDRRSRTAVTRKRPPSPARGASA